MNAKDKANMLKKFAKEQMVKNQEIMDTVRAHFGEDVGDRATLIVNMIVHTQQIETLCMSLLKRISESDHIDVLAVVQSTQAAMDIIERGHEIPSAVFSVLFEDDIKDQIKPFLNQARSNVGAISKQILNAMGSCEE